jgi:signal transduction histidine kinase
MIGIPREQILGKHLDALTLPITRAELERQLSESPTVEVLRSKIRAWGTRMIEVNITALRDAQGRLVGTVSLVRDVTELMRVDEMKSEFISLVSHELRTPLTSIKGYTDLVMAGDAGPINPEQAEFLGIAKSNVDRLVLLINDLLDISRIEAGRIKLHPTTVDLTMLFGETIRSFKPQLEAKAQIVSADLPKRKLQVLADRDRLSQILWNLLSNAHKYSPTGSRIRIKVKPVEAARMTSNAPELIERHAPMIAITVEDEGIGIAAQDQEKLFTKFFRVDNSLTREIGGTGLGLAIVKNFVEMQGGHVWVESPLDAQTGQGTRFTFTVPATEEPLLTVPTPARA